MTNILIEAIKPRCYSLLLAAILFVSMFSPNISTLAQEKINWKTYENRQFGFSMLYPANWNITQYNTSMLDITHYIARISDYHTNLNIFAEELSKNITVKEYARKIYNSVKEGSPFFERINDSESRVDHIPAWKMEYKYNFPDFTGKHLNIVFIKGIMAFQIDYSSKESNYDGNLPKIEKMIDSFRDIK